MKKIIIVVAAVAALTLSVYAQPAQSYFYPSLAINSTATTVTNAHYGVGSNQIWPCYLVGGDICTNFVRIPVTGNNVTFELGTYLTAASGAVTPQVASLGVYTSCSGSAIVTNASGVAPQGLTLQGVVTLSLVSVGASTYASVTTNLTVNAVPYVYVGILNASSLTNISKLTNYTLWYNSK